MDEESVGVQMSASEALAVAAGEKLADVRSRMELKISIEQEALSYRNQPPEKWPALEFKWDMSQDGQCFALDGMSTEKFQKVVPEKLRMGWASLVEFDAKLCRHNRRDGNDELWSLGAPGKLADVIAYVSRGLPITPILMNLLDNGEIFIEGGNHRYSAAKAVKVERIPFYAREGDVYDIDKIISVDWVGDANG